MDTFRTVNVCQSFPDFTQPLQSQHIDQVTPTDYGAFVLEALALMKRGGLPREEPDLPPSSARSEPLEQAPASLVQPPSPSARKRKRGEDSPLPSGSSSASSSTQQNASGAMLPPPVPLTASTSTSAAPSSSSSSPSSASALNLPTPARSAAPSGIDQDVLRQSLLLASSFLITDSYMNPDTGLQTWSNGLSRLIEIIVALHRTDALEIETMRAAALALRECWTAGGSFPGLEWSRERVRQDGLKLKNLCGSDPNRYKGEVIT